MLTKIDHTTLIDNFDLFLADFNFTWSDWLEWDRSQWISSFSMILFRRFANFEHALEDYCEHFADSYRPAFECMEP